MKLNLLELKNFRGISKTQKISFVKNKKAESILLFGDNGTGKSSFIDAIEFITQGTIHNRRTTCSNDWIYNSKSKADDDQTKILCTFDSGFNIEKTYVLDEKDDFKLEIKTVLNNRETIRKNYAIPSFCHAPFVLRRQNIIKFWNFKPFERMKIFIPFASIVQNNNGYIPISVREKIDRINKKRTFLKQKKSKLLKEVCLYYNLDFIEERNKDRDSFFKNVRKKENINGLRDLKHKKLFKKYRKLRKLYNLFDEIYSCNKDIKKIRQNNKRTLEYIFGKFPNLKKTLHEISPRVTEAFKGISNANDYVDRIEIDLAKQTEVSINFIVFLKNGKKTEPERLFSEANKDLLAALIYFEFIYAQHTSGQSKVLVMDDIFQSIDANIRLKLMRYLLNRFKDWQLILTTHDKLWKEQIIRLFLNYHKPLIKYDINSWTFESGPIIKKGTNIFDEKLLNTIKNGDTREICSDAGFLLEYLCDHLSMIIHSGLQRRKNDKYTIGDLWPGIYKLMKKTPARETYKKLNDVTDDRNWVGDHFNAWSLELSHQEAVDFANLVLAAYYEVYNKSKGKWIKDVRDITGENL